jgi:signal peptidase II
VTGAPTETSSAQGIWGPLSATGFAVAIVTLVLDQASKLYMLHVFDLPARKEVQVAPFLDFVMVWNRGISYGLFQQDGWGRWALVALAVAAVAALTVWLARTVSRLAAWSIGLLIGGAIGNAIDRAVYGAVVDFVSVHASGYHWYVFNIADAAIVIGVIGLVWEALLPGHKKV